ncbi:MAG TPA: NEW3 domain-containing protein [Anaerolineae bacterium]|nr:NEW3 domain-containing protein [Anaerolineae bacterium]
MQENQPGTGPLSSRVAEFVGLILVLCLVIGSTVFAQDGTFPGGGGGDQREGPRSRSSTRELSPALPGAVEANTFYASLVQTIDTSAFVPPSPDSAGIVYLDSSNTLLITDSEVDEMPIFTGYNLFRSTLSGGLVGTATTIPWSYEPTGVTYNPETGHLFFSDDNADRIFETNVEADSVLGSFSTRTFGSYDPEGVAYAEGPGVLFIADGASARVYQVTPGGNGFDGVPPQGDDQVTSFSMAGFGVTDLEGIAFNPENGLLYVVGHPRKKVAEMMTEGVLVRMIDISASGAYFPGGLTCGPGSGDPGVTHIYIADRGVDNDTDPNENDGKVYEMTLPPNIPDLTIFKAVEPDSAPLGGEIVYTLAFWNAGEGTATDVVITDIIPESVTVRSVESSGASIMDTGADPPYVWEVEDLGPLESGVITIIAELSDALACGEIVENEASIANAGGDSIPGNNRSSVSVRAGVVATVEPSSDASTAKPGDEVVYTLQVANGGNCEDTFDLSVSGNAWSTVAPDVVGPLAPGASEEVTVTVSVPAGIESGHDVATVTYTSQNDSMVSDSSTLATTITSQMYLPLVVRAIRP